MTFIDNIVNFAQLSFDPLKIMKYSHCFKVLILIALICSFSAQGSTVEFSKANNNLSKKGKSKGYSISVSAGKVQNSQASANLTLSGENSKVSVEKEGTVTLVAGKSIILHPGTKISNGSFLYASIEPVVKSGKRQKQEIKLVTIDEKNKIDEQINLSIAYERFRPFPTRKRAHLHSGDTDHGNLSSSGNELSGVTPEQQRKVAALSRLVSVGAAKQMRYIANPISVANGSRVETMRVLRL